MSDVLKHNLIYRALEPRLVFDGAGAATMDAVVEQTQHVDAGSAASQADSGQAENNALYEALVGGVNELPANGSSSGLSGIVTGDTPAGHEFVFIDSSIEDFETLVIGINPLANVVVLDGDRDGVTQIMDALRNESDVSSIHILAHGDSGELTLGNAVVDVDGLRSDYGGELAIIRDALSDTADILIYGCDFAADAEGAEAVELLSQMTGADIAASNDLTGSADQGGDWELETRVGTIETETISVAAWDGVLADQPPVANNDTVAATEDSRTVFNPLANDSDAEGDVFLTSFSQPTTGEVSIAMGETGSIDVDSVGTTIALDRNYQNPVVFVFTTTQNESSSAPDIARVSNVTGSSFDLAIVEPNSGNASDTTDGVHGFESVSYIVLEAGVWTLGDGTVVEVGTQDVATDAGSFTNVAFNHGFGSAPVVLSQVQTNNNAIDYNEARQRNVAGTGYQVTNEPADYLSSSIGVAERIGYLAVSAGAGSWSGITFEAGLTADNVTHTDQSISFAQDLGPSVNFIAQLHSFDGPDNAHADARNLSGTGVSVSVQEDRTSDSEVNHTSERIGWLALGGDGLLGAASGTNLRMASADVEFIYTTADDVYGSESFTYTIEDTAGQAATATVTLNATPEIDTVTDTATTIDSNPVTLNVLDNDHFEGAVTLTSVSTPLNGTVSFNASGSVTYTPNVGFQGVETLTYTVTEDTLSLVETGSIAITVTSNTAPSAVNDNVAATEDASTIFNPLLNDTDAESDVFLTSFAQPAVGELQLDIGQVGTIDVDSGGTTINLGRSFTNPVVFAFVTTENETQTAPDIARVSNVTGTSFDLRIVEPNSGVGSDTTDGIHGIESVSYIVLEAGVWTLADGTIVEVGTSDVSTGANSFTNVSFEHTFAGSPVVISSIQTNNNAVEYNEARQRNVTGTGYQVTNEPADYQSGSISQAESIGYLVIEQGTGTWSGLDFEAGVTADNITHTNQAISFSSSLASTPNLLAQLHTFDGGDNAHLDASGLTAAGVSFSVQEDRTLDSEVNHTTERAGWLAIGGSGALHAVGGSDYRIASSDVRFSYTAPDDVNGVQSFNYSIEDTHGNTDTGLATLNIAPEVDTSTDLIATSEEVPVSFNVLANDAFEGAVVLSNVLPPANGSVVFDAAGNVTYTPNINFNGTETITYIVTEDTLGVTETGTAVITVTPVNDAPVASDDGPVSITEDTPATGNVLGNDTDVDGDPLTVTQFTVAGVPGTFAAGTTATIPTVGTLVIQTNGTFTFTPALNYNGPVPTATYTISDGNGGIDTADLTFANVTPVNDAPVASDDGPVSVTEDSPATGNVLGNDSDVDGDTLTVTQFTVAGVPGTFAAGTTATIPRVGTLLIQANGAFTFTPALNYKGPVPTATYTISDGNGGTDTADLTFANVTPVNDAPVASDDGPVPVTEDTPATGNVLGNDTDVDGDSLTVTQFTVAGVPGTFSAGTTATIPTVGTLLIQANGAFTFTPALNYNGPVPTATYTISDGNGGTDTADLTFANVTPVNDAPVASDDFVVTDEGRPVAIPVLLNDTDVERDALTVVGATAANGEVVINADGSITYRSSPGFAGRDAVVYTVSDGNGGTAEASVAVLVRTVTHAQSVSNSQSIPETSLSTAESLYVDGAVLDALHRIGSHTGFDGLPAPIRNVQFASELDDDRIVAVLDQPELSRLHSYTLADPNSVQGHALQFPVLLGVRDHAQYAQVVVETVLADNTLVVSISIQSETEINRHASIRLYPENGNAGPAWLTKVQPTLFKGKWPSDADGQQLLLTIEHGEGSSIQKKLYIDFNSGMTHIVDTDLLARKPMPFQEQFNPAEVITDQAVGELGALIESKTQPVP